MTRSRFCECDGSGWVALYFGWLYHGRTRCFAYPHCLVASPQEEQAE